MYIFCKADRSLYCRTARRDLTKTFERDIIVKDFYPNFPKKEVVANERKLYA